MNDFNAFEMTPDERQKWLIDGFGQFKGIGISRLPDGILMFDNYALRYYFENLNAYITLETSDELLLMHQLSLETGATIIRMDKGLTDNRKDVQNIMSDITPWLYQNGSPFFMMAPYMIIKREPDVHPDGRRISDLVKRIMEEDE